MKFNLSSSLMLSQQIISAITSRQLRSLPLNEHILLFKPRLKQIKIKKEVIAMSIDYLDEDIYYEDVLDELTENDEISIEEEGFMYGYLAA